jgi:CRP-like cAMP-binding protein
MDQAIYDKTDAFFHEYPLVRLRKGQAVLAAEQQIPDIFWIRRGMIRMYQITDVGDDITMHLFKAPSFFPIMFYLSHRKGNYYFQAVDEVIARKAPAEEVVAFLKQNPDVLFDLTGRFADAITGLLLRVEQLSTQNTFERVCSLLLYLADKFGTEEDGQCLVDLKLSHDDIAAWIGAARETVSHHIERLRSKGIITSSGRKFKVVNTAQLRKLV